MILGPDLQNIQTFQQQKRLGLVVAFLALGVLTDFVLVGILKVIWIAIYGVSYFAFAMTVETQVSRKGGKQAARVAAVSFLIGTVIGHLLLVQQRREDVYLMSLLSQNPIVLKSEEFPEFLYVQSDRLKQELAASAATEQISVKTVSISDYGCVKRFYIDAIKDIDVYGDTKASWTLRATKLGQFQHPEAPTVQGFQWPWCRYELYRSTL
jgi:hypothetical protein